MCGRGSFPQPAAPHTHLCTQGNLTRGAHLKLDGEAVTYPGACNGCNGGPCDEAGGCRLPVGNYICGYDGRSSGSSDRSSGSSNDNCVTGYMASCRCAVPDGAPGCTAYKPAVDGTYGSRLWNAQCGSASFSYPDEQLTPDFPVPLNYTVAPACNVGERCRLAAARLCNRAGSTFDARSGPCLAT